MKYKCKKCNKSAELNIDFNSENKCNCKTKNVIHVGDGCQNGFEIKRYYCVDCKKTTKDIVIRCENCGQEKLIK